MTASLAPSVALVREALPLFGIDTSARITFIKERENQVFRVESDGQDCAVRIHRPGYRAAVEIECESHHLRGLQEAGLLVPEPVESLLGGYAVPVDRDQRLVSVQRWLPDAFPIADSFQVFTGAGTLDQDDMRQLGTVMGRHHLHAESTTPPESLRRPAWDLDGLFGPGALWGDGTRLRSLTPEGRLSLAQAAEAASLVIEALGRDRSVFGAIHADMTFENVLATGNGLVIIDFDDFGEGWFGFDIATALFFATPHPNFATLAEAFLHGYESVRELDPAVGEALDAFLIARGMSYLGWAAHRPGDPASDFAESRLAPWVVEAAKRFTGSGSTGWLHQDNSSTPQGEI